MTYLDKLSKYVKHEYSIPVPPVSSDMWSVSDWINFIDQHGRWHTLPTKELEHEQHEKSNSQGQES